MGSNATQFWLRVYLQYLAKIKFNVENKYEISYDSLWEKHLKYWTSNTTWESDLVWSVNKYATNDSQTHYVSAMRFTVGLRNFAKPNDQKQAAVLLREIANRWPHYNITTYHHYWQFADLYLQVAPNTFQDMGIGIACMLVIAWVLIPSFLTGLFIAVSIVSIDIGVIGFMTWWNVNLDAISMITLIMCMGFAVDQTAHVAYGYISSSGTAQERTISSLNHLGWPMLQGSLSAILGVSMLATVEAYTIVTFFKTVLLAMTFGAVHGLLFLPVLLSTFIGDSACLPCRKTNSDGNDNLNEIEGANGHPMVCWKV